MTWYCHECHFGNKDSNAACQGTNAPCKHNKCAHCLETEESTTGKKKYNCCKCDASYYVTPGRTMCTTSMGEKCTHSKCGSCTTA